MNVNNDKGKNKSITKYLFIAGGLLIIIGVILALTIKEKPKEEDSPKTVDEQKLETYPYYLVVTARYGGTEEYKEFIDNLFGSNAEESFNNYFQWFNVVHELTHGLIIYNNEQSYLTHSLDYAKNGYLEELKVNDFAAAYWKKYSDSNRLQQLEQTIDYILSQMEDPTNGTMTIEEYGKMIWESDNPDESFETYGWFQFNSVKQSLEKELTLEEAYNNLGLNKKITIDDELLSYDIMNEEESKKVIENAVNKFKKWGLNYPEVYQVFDDDPNQNYSRPITKVEYESMK